MRWLVGFGMVLVAGIGWAAESCTVTHKLLGGNLYQSTWTWTAAANGSLSACASSWTVNGIVLVVETDPGATAPTANYDITLTDTNDIDVMGGALADRSSSANERAVPIAGASDWIAPFEGPLTMNLSNNSVDSATGVMRVYWRRER